MKIAFALLALLPLAAQADTWKCTDASGVVSFSDRPCMGAQRGGQVAVKPQSLPDEQRQRELADERRQNRLDDVQRRAEHAASESQARAERAAYVRQSARDCSYARERAAYHGGYVKGGASARDYEVHKSQLAHYEAEIARHCN